MKPFKSFDVSWVCKVCTNEHLTIKYLNFYLYMVCTLYFHGNENCRNYLLSLKTFKTIK